MSLSLQRLTCALAVCSSVLAPGVWSKPVQSKRLAHTVEDISQPAPLRPRQDSSYFAITGITDDGAIHPRLEIRDLQANADQWNMYLLGLQRLQSVDESDKLSWYGIMGVHGMPFTPWDGVEPTGYPEIGYCTHDSNLFLPWHRPYVALYEQVLQSNMMLAAQEFPEGDQRDKYVSACRSWRAPHWDWARLPPDGETNVPPFLTTPEIQVTTPNGTQMIHNPLYSYVFHPLDGKALYDAFSVFPETKRYPTNLSADAVSQEGGTTTNMNNLRPQLRDALYDLFTNYNNFTIFSNMASYHPSQYNSLEAVHGWVHNYVGGSNGNMLEVPWSAFDATFMLHHAMVDRCFALWQALNPDSYVEPEVQDYSTYMINQGSTQDADSPLAPFHSSTDGTFWTPNTARSTETFHYTYPELESGNRTALVAAINNLYGTSTVGHATKRSLKLPLGGSAPLPLLQPGHISDPASATTSRYEYNVNIKLEKCALGGPGNVLISLGHLGLEPGDWLQSPNLAGSSPLFVAGNTAAMRMGASSDIYVSVPITQALEERVSRGELPCMDPVVVVPYLAANLEWQVTKMDNTPVPNENVSGLLVSVVSSQFRPSVSVDSFPERIGGVLIHANVTEGRPGGLNASMISVGGILESLS
ncbi:Di-copper centre-containing protein [Saccharata proteae CBS 121410]|uniref:Di-copper centre-containing protein n=1 Tax=Saccharata proteae CBS 121410 TaxID=1314787 RepID=A0A9P4HM55_9PEZI|nr:Di-copper centre-containing protein [Saccharata proteae CBS 121410]